MVGKSPSIADLLEATSRELAGTDARVYRRLGTHLERTEQAIAELKTPATEPGNPALSLLGRGSFVLQSVATLKALCKQNGIASYSKLKKAELVRALEQHGLQPPPRPLESFNKKELIELVRQLLSQQGG
jgi:hypothetical protein